MESRPLNSPQDASRRITMLMASCALGLAYCLWAQVFIQRTFVHVSGRGNWYCLFDDAMISMRYALNWAHGQGLVWNPGEKVEGYTNFLQVAFMAAAIRLFGARIAPLMIQILGMFFVLGSAGLAFPVAKRVLDGNEQRSVWTPAFFAAASVLAFYPLSYWSLMGMETGLLTFLLLLATYIALRCREETVPSWAFGLCLGLMTLTRPDASLQALVLLAFPLWESWHDKRIWRRVILEGLAFALLPLALEYFRWSYYGQLVPNTYVLKMTGWPLALRLKGGMAFTKLFFDGSWLLELLALGYVLVRGSKAAWLLWLLHLSHILYQAWVGGDPWLYWRIYTPSVPFLLILAMGGATIWVQGLARGSGAAWLLWLLYLSHSFFQAGPGGEPWRHWSVHTPSIPSILILAVGGASLWAKEWKWLAPALVLTGLLLVNLPFRWEIEFVESPYTVEYNAANVRVGLALNRLLDPQAHMAVFWAGSAPYYCGCKAVDMLGKCDPHIARVPLDKNLGFSGIPSVPGHNKYDLSYSIEKMQPDWVEGFKWGHDDLEAYRNEHYQHVGAVGWLKKKSPYVHWNLLKQDPSL